MTHIQCQSTLPCQQAITASYICFARQPAATTYTLQYHTQMKHSARPHCAHPAHLQGCISDEPLSLPLPPAPSGYLDAVLHQVLSLHLRRQAILPATTM